MWRTVETVRNGGKELRREVDKTRSQTAPFGASNPHTDLQFRPQMPRFVAKLAAIDIPVPIVDQWHMAGQRSGWGGAHVALRSS